MYGVSMIPHARIMGYHWHRMLSACRVIDTACTMHMDSLTLHEQCMQGHWQRMHGACGVIDPASIWNVWTTLTNESHLWNGFAMQKNEKCMRCHWHRLQNIAPHVPVLYNRRTIRAALTAFKGKIYQKHSCTVHILSYPITTKLYKLKGAIY
jgi:hypothetical protein